MHIVRVKTKNQVALPSEIAERVGLNVGDFLEARIEQGNIVLKPQTLVDQHIAESRQQIKNGQFYGPFNTADEAIESLRKNSKNDTPHPK